jgi:hypothetical protein
MDKYTAVIIFVIVDCIEQISYECEKSRHTARSRHGNEKIFSTNHIGREHFSSNQNARTRHHHGHGTITVTAPVRTVTFSQSYEICSNYLVSDFHFNLHSPQKHLIGVNCCITCQGELRISSKSL